MSDSDPMNLDVDRRVVRLDGIVEGLAKQIQAHIDVSEREHRLLRQELRDLATSYHSDNKTPWGTMAGWASVSIAFVIAIVALGASGPLGVLQDLKADQRTIAQTLRNHVNVKGHPYVLEKTASLERSLERLSDSALSERDRVRVVIDKAVAAADTRLQSEMRLLDKNQDAQLAAIKERVAVVSAWQRENNVGSSARHATSTARLDALESRFDRLDNVLGREQNWAARVIKP